MAEDTNQTVKWGVRRRLEFIDFRLFWDGRFNRKDLADVFGISAQQASADIAQYEELAPKNLTYDRTQKTYVRTTVFEPIFIAASSDRFLLQLVAIESRWMRKEDTWFDTLPPVEVVSLGRRATDSSHLLRVLDAIRGRQEMDIEYQSMTGSSNTSRIVAPHALAYNAGRWYVRAWSRDHNDFRDYNLNRIRSVGDLRNCPIDPKLDFQWAHTINLVLAPNPNLSEARQDAVAAEYDMMNRRLLVPTRLSLCFYLMSEHNLDVAAGLLSPEKQQLVLLNYVEVEQARSSARQLSIEALARATLR
jgi:WYL domain